MNAYFAQLLDSIKATESQAQIQQAIKYIAFFNQSDIMHSVVRIITGAVTVFLLSISLGNLFLARWCQASTFNPGGLRSELYQIRLPTVDAIIFAVLLLGLLTGIDLIWDLVPIICFPFVIASLSLIHRVASVSKKWWLWLGIFYLLLIGFFPIMLKVLVLLALTDSVFDIRARYRLIT